MTFDKLVQKRMLLLIILLLMISTYFGGIGNIGINKTVGWDWDISNWLFFSKIGLWLIFIIGYGILTLLKYWTNKNLSKLHLVLITLTFVADDILNMDLRLILTLNVISALVFLMNFICSIRNRNVKLTKRAST